MTRETRKTVNTIVRYVVLIVVGFIMIYPLIWMVGATLKRIMRYSAGLVSYRRIRRWTVIRTR